MLTLQPIDIVLAILLLGFILWGFKNGLIRALGGLIGILIAAALAGRYYDDLAGLIGRFFGQYQGLATVVSFALIFLIIGKLFGFIVILFERAFDVLAFLPFLRGINYLLGAAFGFLIGTVVIGTLLFVSGRFIEWQEFTDMVAASALAQFLLAIANFIAPLLPEALRQLRSYF